MPKRSNSEKSRLKKPPKPDHVKEPPSLRQALERCDELEAAVDTFPIDMSEPLWKAFSGARKGARVRSDNYNPEQIWQLAMRYFEWCDANPFIEDKVGFFEGTPTNGEVKKQRPYSLDGLCIALGIARNTWNQWRKNPTFSDLVSQLDMILREQKVSGAAAGIFNASIVSRLEGLAENVNNHHSGEGVSLSLNYGHSAGAPTHSSPQKSDEEPLKH